MKRAVATVAACALFGLAGGAAAATAEPLLDIPTPYLPSTNVAVDEMLRLADVGPGDFVADLGSGDGRVVISAARDYGARGIGIELDPKLVAEAQANARQAGVSDRVSFRQGDVLATISSLPPGRSIAFCCGTTMLFRNGATQSCERHGGIVLAVRRRCPNTAWPHSRLSGGGMPKKPQRQAGKDSGFSRGSLGISPGLNSPAQP